jgi:hypothetical protein
MARVRKGNGGAGGAAAEARTMPRTLQMGSLAEPVLDAHHVVSRHGTDNNDSRHARFSPVPRMTRTYIVQSQKPRQSEKRPPDREERIGRAMSAGV